MRDISLLPMVRGVRVGLFGLLLCCAPISASAQSTDTEIAAARVLFNEARELEKQDRWSEALPKLEAVGRVRMTPQVRFHIALCQENIGRLVSANNGFEQARREASRAGIAQVVRESVEHIEYLKARIPTLHIQLNEQRRETIEVLIDGASIQTSLLTVPIPLDPGKHNVRATAPGRLAFDSTVVLVEGQRSRLLVALSPQPIAAAPDQPPIDAVQPKSPNQTPGWILIATGGALIVGASASAMVRASALSEIEDSCPTHNNCDPALEDSRERAQTHGTAAVVMGGLGVLAAGAGGYLLWSSGKDSDATTVSMHPAVHAQGLGMSGAVQW